MVEIVQKDDKVLRKKAKKVDLKDIGGEKINKIVAEMKEALASQDDGVAIAAPQIGVSLRIFVISGKAFAIMKKEDPEKNLYADMVFINPEITKISKEKKPVEEGCLSVRYLYGKVNRATKASVKAYDEKGNLFERGGSGLLAQIFQHEIEHLDGELFIDKATDVKDMPPENISKNGENTI